MADDVSVTLSEIRWQIKALVGCRLLAPLSPSEQALYERLLSLEKAILSPFEPGAPRPSL
jgi:hypothetical protein